MPAEFVEDTIEAGPAIGRCDGCGDNIYSGMGVTVAVDGRRFHPACRTTVPAPKRRGRPPKPAADEVLGE